MSCCRACSRTVLQAESAPHVRPTSTTAATTINLMAPVLAAAYMSGHRGCISSWLVEGGAGVRVVVEMESVLWQRRLLKCLHLPAAVLTRRSLLHNLYNACCDKCGHVS